MSPSPSIHKRAEGWGVSVRKRAYPWKASVRKRTRTLLTTGLHQSHFYPNRFLVETEPFLRALCAVHVCHTGPP